MKYIYTYFKPSLVFMSVLDIPESVVYNSKIKVILLDVDNTIIPYKEIKMGNSFKRWLKNISKCKKVILITNGSKKRIRKIPELKKFEYICRACKPIPFCYTKVLKKYKVNRERAIVIGDQVFDDILGGNFAGIYTILVRPLQVEKPYRIRIKRYLENKILYRMRIM